MCLRYKKWGALLLLLVVTLKSLGQEGVSGAWRMQPVHIPTRWAESVTPESVYGEYPRPGLVRKHWESLNGLWDYCITSLKDSVPHWSAGKILVPFPIESALSGVKKALLPQQTLWYRRSIRKPPMKADDRLILNFGAVDWNANVYLNGKRIGEHNGGYQSFSIDISDYLIDGDNELLVRVVDPTDRGMNPHGKQVLEPGNIYYTASSGIWQTVWMEIVSTAYVSTIKVRADIDNNVAIVDVKLVGDNKKYLMEVSASNGAKKELIVDASMVGNSRVVTLPMHEPRLWSPQDPYLYDLKIRLFTRDRRRVLVDEVKSYFGMRKISVMKDRDGYPRMYLNNNYTYQLGVLDQGFWPDGLMSAPNDEALSFDIKAIKAMGFNTIRKHIKIEPERWYYHADKIGMLVWQDFVNPPHSLPEGSKTVFEKEMIETMSQLGNHPSIVIWVLFNEQWGAYDQARLTSLVRKLDPSRLVNGHSGEFLYVDDNIAKKTDSAWVNSDIADIHSYPEPMNPPDSNTKGKIKVLGEFGGIGVSVPGHQWNDLSGWGYIQATPGTLEEKYRQMIFRIKDLEKKGLSGSIYTQPFDVEDEENGLMTYDRRVVKIPFSEIAQINALILPNNKSYLLKDSVINLDTNDTDQRYPELLTRFRSGLRDSTFLRRLVLMALRKRDSLNAAAIGSEYLQLLTDKYSQENLRFIDYITRSPRDAGFRIFFDNRERVNEVLGKNHAEYKIREIIERKEISPLIVKNENPDWEQIALAINTKYGALGSEAVWGTAMLKSLEVEDWDNFGLYYTRYYREALDRSAYNINNMSFYLFLNVTDTAVLQFAANISKYNMENLDNTWEAIDTYANLLYKIGEVDQAIEWELKALTKSNNDATVRATLNKMRSGIPTWTILR